MINDFHLSDTRFLSNFAYSSVLFDGVSYAIVEHAYQAAKTLDLEQRKAIKQAMTPNQAKQLGKRVTLRANWRGICLGIMLDLLRKKFTIPAMRRALVATGLHELIEGNYWNDTYWGVCNGVGENHLGKLLMQVRDEIIASGYKL